MSDPWAIDPARVPPGGRPTLNLYLNWLVVVLAFALPLYRQWVSITVPLIMVLWLLEGGLRRKMRMLWGSRTTLAVVAFVLFNLLSLLWSADPAGGFDYLSKYRYLLLLPIIATSMRSEYRRPTIVAWAVGVTVSVCLLLLVAVGALPQLAASPRNPAVTMSHLDYSMVLAVAALLAVDRLVSARLPRRQRIAVAAFAAVSVAGLLVNIGRSGQLAFFCGLLIVTPRYLSGSRWWKLLGATAIVSAVAVAGYLSAPVFHDRVDAAARELVQAFRGENYTTNQGKRIAGMLVAAEIVRQHPILGTGVGDNMVSFRQLLDGPYSELKEAVAWFPHMHNQYLQVATELGLVGLLILLNIFLQALRDPVPDRSTRTQLIAVCAIYLVGFVADPFFHKQLPVALFGTATGVLFSPILSVWDLAGSDQPPSDSSSPLTR